MQEFGKIKMLNMRDLWSNEATVFTPWVVENIADISQILGMDLEVKEREANIGDFFLDIHAHDLNSNKDVIIENQLTKSDHDHLGKTITYAAGLNASVVIWIAESFRDEHRSALEWLNQRTDSETQFFGIIVEAFQIDDSKPAYIFRPVISPNDWEKSNKSSNSGQISKKGESYQLFFQKIIDELRNKYRFTNAKKGQPQSWYYFQSGKSGFYYGLCFVANRRFRVELYIDKDDKEKNESIFELLYNQKENVENQFEQELAWEKLEDKRACRVACYFNGSIDDPFEEQDKYHRQAISMLLRFKEVFSPLLDDICKNE